MDDLSVIGISKRNFINFLGNAGARSLGELAPSFVAYFFVVTRGHDMVR